MIALLIDADNLSSPAWIDEAVQAIERNDGDIAIRRAYGSAENLKGMADVLRSRAIRPFVNLSLTKNTTDVSLAVDAMELACLTPRPKLMVIASGDLDFIPLVVRLRERGIRVICVSERSKMAQDAIPAYDQIMYVGAEQIVTAATKKPETMPVAVATIATLPKKTSMDTPAVKPAAQKAVPAKKASPENVVKKTTSSATKTIKTHKEILAALPNIQTGKWLQLSEVAKILHDKKLLAKSATSTKLFRKFPESFELTPARKPNQVRFIKI